MSAFIVSSALFDVVLSFAQAERLVLPHPDDMHGHALDLYSVEIATLFGRALLAQNLQSVADHYGPSCPHFPELADREAFLACYRYRPDARARAPLLDALALIKATHCYDYQACETQDYPASWAAAVMRQIREAAVLHLPGYDRAPWGYEALTAPAGAGLSAIPGP